MDRDTNSQAVQALRTAAETLRHIAQGGSYDLVTYYTRLHSIEAALDTLTQEISHA